MARPIFRVEVIASSGLVRSPEIEMRGRCHEDDRKASPAASFVCEIGLIIP